jgi:cell division protein FtsW
MSALRGVPGGRPPGPALRGVPGAAERPDQRPRVFPWLAMLDRPLASYHLILGSTGLLLAIGLAMVLSTSSASQLDVGGSPYSVFAKQLLGALVGLPMMWVLSRTPPRLFRVFARPLLWASIGGLVLVLAYGTAVNGAERWISVAGVQIQPSEFAKLALLIWGADLLARKETLKQLNDWRALLVPLLPGACMLCLLVMLGDDLGTTFILLVILLTLLWVLGTPARLFACLLGFVVFALLMLALVKSYREGRLLGFLHPSGDPTGADMQSIQGLRAIGSGGLFGVGLGDSKLKWGWVPDASNDFIFAILGEELGLIGTACVVFLYGGIAYAGLRVARRMTEPFTRLAAAAITVWIVVQALVNICAVVGLLPITGVPLPLISQGLSSLLVTMAAIGVLLSLARREPGASEALAAAGPGIPLKIARSLGLAPKGRPPAPPGRGAAWTDERLTQRRVTREGGTLRRPGMRGVPGGRPPGPTPPRQPPSRLAAQGGRPAPRRADRAGPYEPSPRGADPPSRAKGAERNEV